MKLKDKGTKSRIDLLMRGKLLYHFAGLMAVLLNYAEVPPPSAFITANQMALFSKSSLKLHMKGCVSSTALFLRLKERQ